MSEINVVNSMCFSAPLCTGSVRVQHATVNGAGFVCGSAAGTQNHSHLGDEFARKVVLLACCKKVKECSLSM